MEKINAIMKNINVISKIPFKICNELGDIYISPSFVLYDNCVEKEFHYLNEKFKIIVNNEDSNAISLLIYCIENSIGTAESDNNDIVDRIISGNTFEEDEIKKEFPLLMQKMYVMMIYIDGSNQEAYELIKECYDEKEIIVVKNEEKIIILGLKKDINEHALSIRDTLNSNVAGKIIISYTSELLYKTFEYSSKLTLNVSDSLFVLSTIYILVLVSLPITLFKIAVSKYLKKYVFKKAIL